MWQEGWPLQSSGISQGCPPEQAEAPLRDWQVGDLKKKKETYRQKDNQLQSWQPHQTSCCELWAWDKHYIVDICCGWIRLRKKKKMQRRQKQRRGNLKRKQPSTPTCKIHPLFYSGDLHFPPNFSMWFKTGDLLCSCTTHIVLQVNTSPVKPPDKKKKKKKKKRLFYWDYLTIRWQNRCDNS